jgi:parallel beta-helix repeat protein/predicted outer membrane repeat protein
VSGFLDPDQLIPTDSSVFRMYATEEAYPGVHSITITATGGEIIREKEVTLAILPPGYYGPVWYVSTEGDDSTGNGSPEFPFRTIQKGIQTATDGDTVLAAPGTYNEHVNFDGKALLVTSQAGAESTIISKLYDDLPIVTFDSGEDSNSVLDGFTIQNANNPDGYGGAIQCYDHSSPTIRNHILKDNVAGSGAGVDIRSGCSPIIENNRIIGNSSSGSGGGIHCYGQSSPTIRQNLFIENSAFWMGGGISCRHYCSPPISENWFIQNSAGNDGGGLYCRDSSSPIISQNLFIQNYAGKAGGAVYCFQSSSPVILANTLDRNTSNEWGGSITCHSSSSPEIRNTIVSNELVGYGIYAEEGSYPTITYCDVWNNASGNFSGCTPGDGCISDDPVFCDPENGNYYLQNTSPCLGAGQGGSDIGALPAGCTRGDVNGDGTIDIADITYLINYLFIDGSAPDPSWVGDANSDGVVDVADVAYLINYLFIDGPPPCGPQVLPAFQPLGRG